MKGIPFPALPGEGNAPICRIGDESTEDSAGVRVQRSEPLYMLVPMFALDEDTNPSDAFTPALGATLIKLFGAVPEAFKTHPLVAVQCPNSSGSFGSCTLHASQVDIYPALVALHRIPATSRHTIFVPTPNHTHIVNDHAINTNAIWWQVITVLVTSPLQWPNAQGTSGITSKAKLVEAERDAEAIEASTNLFLFFSSKSLGGLSQLSSPQV